MSEGPWKLSKGWRWVRLREVYEVVMGQSPPSKTYNTGSYQPWLRKHAVLKED